MSVSTDLRRCFHRRALRFSRLVLGILLMVSALGSLARGANTFTTTGSLSALRYGHTATLLPNGKVLVAGGSTGTNFVTGTLSGAELYDAGLSYSSAW